MDRTEVSLMLSVIVALLLLTKSPAAVLAALVGILAVAALRDSER